MLPPLTAASPTDPDVRPRESQSGPSFRGYAAHHLRKLPGCRQQGHGDCERRRVPVCEVRRALPVLGWALDRGPRGWGRTSEGLVPPAASTLLTDIGEKPRRLCVSRPSPRWAPVRPPSPWPSTTPTSPVPESCTPTPRTLLLLALSPPGASSSKSLGRLGPQAPVLGLWLVTGTLAIKLHLL